MSFTDPYNHFKDIRPDINPLMKDKVKVEFNNLINKMFETFNAFKTAVPHYSDKLLEANYTIHEVKETVDQVVVTLSKLPSLADFLTIIGNKYPKQNRDKSKQDEIARNQEDQKKLVKEMEEKFIRVFGEDKVMLAVDEYFFGLYPEMEVGFFGLSRQLWKLPFFIDLYEVKKNNPTTSFSLQELIQKAIEQGRKHGQSAKKGTSI